MLDISALAQLNGLRYIEVQCGSVVKHLLLPNGPNGNPQLDETIKLLLTLGRTQTDIASILGIHRPEVVRRSRKMGFSLKKGRK